MNAELVSILAWLHQAFNRQEYQAYMSSLDDAKLESHCCTSSHSQSDLDNHSMILENSKNRSLKGTSSLLLAAGQQEKRLKRQLEQLLRSNLRSGIYQLFLLLSATWKVLTIQLQNQTGECWNCRSLDLRLCSGKLGKPMTMKELGPLPALSVWTSSGMTNCSELLHNLTRLKFKEAQGAGGQWQATSLSMGTLASWLWLCMVSGAGVLQQRVWESLRWDPARIVLTWHASDKHLNP